MRDRPTERPGLRALDIDMDPLMIAGHLGEAIYAVLVDAQPLGRTEQRSFLSKQIGRMIEDGRHHQARWLETERTSPVM